MISQYLYGRQVIDELMEIPTNENVDVNVNLLLLRTAWKVFI